MKKFIAITTSTVLLSLLGASDLNMNTIQIVSAAGTEYNTTNVERNMTKLEAKDLLGNYKATIASGDVNEIVKNLGVKGLTNIATCNIKNKKELKTIINKMKNQGSSIESGSKAQTTKTITTKAKKVTKVDTAKKASTTKKTKTPPKATPAPKVTKAPKVTPAPKVTKTPKATPTPKVTQAPKATPTPKVTQAPKATPAPTKAPTTAPKTTTTPQATTTSNSSVSSFAEQVLQLVNKERAKEGLSALTTNTTLASAANKRAEETVQSFSHTRPNGTSFFTVLKEFSISYQAAGENIAYGQKTPQEVVTGWMNSPGHRANIMNGQFGKIGIGVHKTSNGTIYWTQVFTN